MADDLNLSEKTLTYTVSTDGKKWDWQVRANSFVDKPDEPDTDEDYFYADSTAVWEGTGTSQSEVEKRARDKFDELLSQL